MRKEMPRRYWHNLPEAQLISPLIKAAQARSSAMLASAPSTQHPAHSSAGCRAKRPEFDSCQRWCGLPWRQKRLKNCFRKLENSVYASALNDLAIH